MVETFNAQQFSEALPVVNGEPLFTYNGLKAGEKTWVWEMPNNDIRILIRSSISSNDVSATTGEDSIRLIIEYKSASGWKACGKGPDAYTTRVTGWQERLRRKIKELFNVKIKPVAPGSVRNLVEGEFFAYSTKVTSNGRAFVSMAGDVKTSTFRWVS